MEAKQCIVRDPVPSQTHSNKCLFTHSPRDVQGANVNDEAWKTHTTRVLKQGTLVYNSYISQDITRCKQATGR